MNKNEIEMEPAFPRETTTVDGSIRYTGLTKLEYATFEILKSPYWYKGLHPKLYNEDLIKCAIKLAKEALKQLAAEYK